MADRTLVVSLQAKSLFQKRNGVPIFLALLRMTSMARIEATVCSLALFEIGCSLRIKPGLFGSRAAAWILYFGVLTVFARIVAWNAYLFKV
jgi:hypothetical protein